MTGLGDRPSWPEWADRIDGRLDELAATNVELWAAIAELRDELHDLSLRVDTVHRGALRALTDSLKGRNRAQPNTEHTQH